MTQFHPRPALAFTLLLALTGCGKIDPCLTPCSGDPVPTAAELKSCRDSYAANTKCVAEGEAINACAWANIQCDANKKSIPLDFFGPKQVCQKELLAVQKCASGG